MQKDTMDSTHFLKTIYQSPALSEADLKQILSAHKAKTYKKGDYFLCAGQDTQEYFCLESGLARTYVLDYDNNDITTNLFSGGNIIIDVAALFGNSPAQEYAQALTDCLGWQLDYDDFQRLYHSIPAFSEWGRAWMTQSMVHLKQRMISMITLDAKSRYLALLASEPTIVQQVPLKHIATFLGITDTSLSRIRADLNRVSY